MGFWIPPPNTRGHRKLHKAGTEFRFLVSTVLLAEALYPTGDAPIPWGSHVHTQFKSSNRLTERTSSIHLGLLTHSRGGEGGSKWRKSRCELPPGLISTSTSHDHCLTPFGIPTLFSRTMIPHGFSAVRDSLLSPDTSELTNQTQVEGTGLARGIRRMLDPGSE